MNEKDYIPALRFRFLTPLFDSVIRWPLREETFKRKLLEQADLRDGQRVLDLGCGTGTLAGMVKRHVPAARVVGLDADPAILERARAKSEKAGADIRFDEGFSDDLPYEDGSFDRVLSTLFFHHLTTEVKRRTVGEIARVLRPGGELHVGDLGRPSGWLMHALVWQVRLVDGMEQTRVNVAGALPSLFEEGGLVEASEHERLRTAFGTLVIYSAKKPTAAQRAPGLGA